MVRTFTGDSLCAYDEVVGYTETDANGNTVERVSNARIIPPAADAFDPVWRVEIGLQDSAGEWHSTLVGCDLPRGRLACVGGSSLAFGDTQIDTVSAGEMVLSNSGDDCIEITAIPDQAPFHLASTNPALPASLEPEEQMTLSIEFRPQASGITPTGPNYTFYDEILPISSNPARGCQVISCQGRSFEPYRELSLSWSTPLCEFEVPIGDTVTGVLTVQATGTLPIWFSIASANGVPAGKNGGYSWEGTKDASGNVEIIELASRQGWSQPVEFSPNASGEYIASIYVLEYESASATIPVIRQLPLTCRGCDPKISLTAEPTEMEFGDVQHGLPKPLLLRLTNDGNLPVDYSLNITDDGDGRYRVQRTSDSISSSRTSIAGLIDPRTPCGDIDAGSGTDLLAVLYQAKDDYDETHAGSLEIEYQDFTGKPQSVSIKLFGRDVPAVPIDAVVALDRSASMGDLLAADTQDQYTNSTTAPRNKIEATIDAAGLFIDLTRPAVDDRLALLGFNQEPALLQAMTSIGDGTGDTVTKDALVAQLSADQGGALEPSGFTGLAGALVSGSAQFEVPRTTGPADYRKVLILLTDGQGNRAYLSEGNWYTVLGVPSRTPDGTTVPQTKAVPLPEDIAVYPIGIGSEEDIDKAQLAYLARQHPDRRYHLIESLQGQDFFALEKLFVQIFMDTVDLQMINDPVHDLAPGEQREDPFTVVSGDTSVLVVVFNPPGEPPLPFALRSPIDEVFTSDSVPTGFRMRTGRSRSARFIELGLPPGEPKRSAGQWRLLVTHPTLDGNQASGLSAFSSFGKKTESIAYGFSIGAGSNFRLRPDVGPERARIGEPIRVQAMVTEGGLPVEGCWIQVTAIAPNGKAWELHLEPAPTGPTLGTGDGSTDASAQDSAGAYQATFRHTQIGGSYKFRYRLKGTTRDKESVYREAEISHYVEGRVQIGDGDQGPAKGSG